MNPYYEHAGITIYHADCREVLSGLAWDVVIQDPPFEAEAHTKQRRVKRGGGVREIESLGFEAMDEDTRAAVARELGRTPRWVLTFCQIEAAPIWREAYENLGGLNYRRTCIWVKPDGMPQYSGDRPGMGYETLLAMHAKGASRWNGGGRHGVFTVNKADGWTNGAPHPTTKPERLMKLLAGLFSDKDDVVLDPFMGSGTTLRAAKDIGRRAIGIEINERYCEIAAKRMAQETLFPVAEKSPDECSICRGRHGSEVRHACE